MQDGVILQSEHPVWLDEDHTRICSLVNAFDGCGIKRGENVNIFKGIWADGTLLVPRKSRRPNDSDKCLSDMAKTIVALGAHAFGPDFRLSTIEQTLTGVHSKGQWHTDVTGENIQMNLMIALKDVNTSLT